jgi:hypothetical protein
MAISAARAIVITLYIATFMILLPPSRSRDEAKLDFYLTQSAILIIYKFVMPRRLWP